MRRAVGTSVYVDAVEMFGSRLSRAASSSSVFPTCRSSVCPPMRSSA